MTLAHNSDVEMESRVVQRLRGMGAHLRVKVQGGVVTLSGIAEDYGEKRLINSAVKMISGIHEVRDRVRVIYRDGSFDDHR